MKERQRWSGEEDALLRAYVRQYGPREWHLVSHRMNIPLHRDAKSCLERWKNYLKPGIKKGSLTEEEQRLVIRLQAKHGNKWKKIAAEVPGRTAKRLGKWWEVYKEKQQREEKKENSHAGNGNRSAVIDPIEERKYDSILETFAEKLVKERAGPAFLMAATASNGGGGGGSGGFLHPGGGDPLPLPPPQPVVVVAPPPPVAPQPPAPTTSMLPPWLSNANGTSSAPPSPSVTLTLSSSTVASSSPQQQQLQSNANANANHNHNHHLNHNHNHHQWLNHSDRGMIGLPPPPPTSPLETITPHQHQQHLGLISGLTQVVGGGIPPPPPPPTAAAALNFGESGGAAAVVIAELADCCRDVEEGHRAWVAHKKEAAWRLKRVELQLESEKASRRREKMDEIEAKIKALREEERMALDRIEAEYREQLAGLVRDAEAKEHKLADNWGNKHHRLSKFLDQIGCSRHTRMISESNGH